jgi:hypothetical protein
MFILPQYTNSIMKRKSYIVNARSKETCGRRMEPIQVVIKGALVSVSMTACMYPQVFGRRSGIIILL